MTLGKLIYLSQSDTALTGSPKVVFRISFVCYTFND